MSISEKIIQGMKEALVSAGCDHAFVMTPDQPTEPHVVRVFCPRCEGTFTLYDEPPMSNRPKSSL